MGSTGSGSFSDYSSKNRESQGGDSSDGGSGDIECLKAFSASLEDIQDYEFFLKRQTVLTVGAQLFVEHRSRIVVVDGDGLIVGALPTRLNYLASCLRAGFKYIGVVRSSGMTPIPFTEADFAVED
ncbi:MAG: hypothetical protein KC777_14680 [Cyanobacteria bacterium HKST-UBA02]|nr:hypothetical protein [Cyanobacteria bacterium HKST-UBA02]